MTNSNSAQMTAHISQLDKTTWQNTNKTTMARKCLMSNNSIRLRMSTHVLKEQYLNDKQIIKVKVQH